MNDGSASTLGSAATSPFRSYPLPVRATALAMAYLLLALAGNELTRQAGNVAAVWPPNAILLAVLLRSERRDWPIYAVGCGLANVIVNLGVGHTLAMSCGFALVHLSEVLTGALMVRYISPAPITLTSVSQIVTVAFFAGLVAPLIGAIAGAVMISFAFQAPFWTAWITWWIADGMGILLISPVFLLYGNPHYEGPSFLDGTAEKIATIVATVGVTSMLFSQGGIPWLFVVPLFLLWSALRLGLCVTALSGLLVTAVSICLTVYGYGPIAALSDITLAERVSFLQVFLGTSVLASLFVSATLAERDQVDQAFMRQSADLQATNLALEASLQQRDTLLKELQHRVKNSLQVVVSLLNLRSDRAQESLAKEAIVEASHRVEALSLAHRYFYEPDLPHQTALSEYIPELCMMLAKVYAIGEDRVEVKTDVAPITIPLSKITPVSLILNELVSNVFKHAFPGDRRGVISIQFRGESDQQGVLIGSLCVADDGIGLPDHFDLDTVKSMGLMIFRSLVGQIDGKVEIDRRQGVRFHIRFPLKDEEAEK